MARPQTYFLVDGPLWGSGAVWETDGAGGLRSTNKAGWGPNHKVLFVLGTDAFEIQARARDTARANERKAMEVA